ncbi:VOC family protein [Paenibacillus apis]|uniref:VOC family protein n=1 Tax=Paenibacillus apis TaxID=1792174 RepID=A0A919Y4B3_9BACL|nr:VOC family protein [Paenibacillus apis]GIO43861.1 VOC family protein [Paenibacillus apis]
MLKITPNLHFKGQCKQAIQLYKEAFNAQVKVILCESDANPSDWTVQSGDEDLVYHCEMYIGSQRLMLNDSSDEDAHSLKHTMSVVVTFNSATEVECAFSKLSDGCTLIHPMQSTSYSSCFVSLIDKFGMRWELMTEQAK